MLRPLIARFRDLRQHPVYGQHRLLVLWRASMWSLHCLFKIPARAKFQRWNFRLYLLPKWRGGGCTAPYLFRQHYEPELMLLEQYLKPGMVFVDGGANTGVFTCTAARLVGPTGQVLAFEPGASSFAMLCTSLAINNFSQVHLSQAALSDRTGTARLYHHQQQENAFSLGAEENVPYDEVAVVSLDEATNAASVPRVDFIKLDVEGVEELVLRGADNVLRQWQPVVLFEVNPDAIRRLGLATNGACQLLKEHGYQLFGMNEAGQLTADPSVPNQLANLLALPPGKSLERKSGSPHAMQIPQLVTTS